MFTIWTNSMTVAYKTRQAYHPQYGLLDSREEFVEETAYWFDPDKVASGLTEEQARNLLHHLRQVATAALGPVDEAAYGGPAKSRRAHAHNVAIRRKESVEVVSFWATADDAGPDGASLDDHDEDAEYRELAARVAAAANG